ncbi:MAG: hypothetical protein M3Y33_03940, partial [Actinomycetota bacterium]|nr:hypothetical protein [Actinomycetota bacterium]
QGTPGADLDLTREPADAGLTLLTLAWVLRTTLVPTGKIPTRYITCVQRTSPSGGSRHPTELAVILCRSLGEIPTGTYTYDIASHSLVAEPAEVHAEYAAALPDRDFGILVRTRVERAMWRYRDLRALRPVLIDAGHVSELVTFLLGRAGISTELVSAPVASLRPSWLEEPEVALIRPCASAQREAPSSLLLPKRAFRSQDDAGAYLTSPALVLRFGKSMYASAFWPSPRNISIDLTDFLVLNHCLPSTRGDRDSSAAGITRAVPDASVAAIERLHEAGALLAAGDAQLLYDSIRPWIRHEWYMAFLAYLEILGHGTERPVASRIDNDGAYIGDLGTLFRRRTSRAFSPAPLAVGQVENLIHRVFQNGQHPGLEISLASWNVNGLGPGLYRWRNGRLIHVDDAPERAMVAANSAGQTGVSAGALAIWVSSLTEVDRPQRYQMDLVDLGRLGQRICMVATELGMATFLTPAVYDTETCSMLGIEAADRRLTYVFGLGVPRTAQQPVINGGLSASHLPSVSERSPR